MRRKFDQYVNVRPAYLFEGVPCPLVGKAPGSIDMMVYRENTEGEYATDWRSNLYEGTENDEVAVQAATFHSARLRANYPRGLRLQRSQAASRKLTHFHHQVERAQIYGIDSCGI